MPNARSPREVYVTALKNAHSMTAETRTVLQRQAEHAKAYPDVAGRLAQQAAEVGGRLPRLEEALAGLDEKASSFKDLVTSTVGAAAEIGHAATGDTEIKDYFVAASFAALNHTAFRSLKVSAELAGEGAGASWIDAVIQADEAFGRWLFDNVDRLTRDYTARVAQGEAATPT